MTDKRFLDADPMGAAGLPAELVWDEAGHLSEMAQTAVADGEEALLPKLALAHLEECERCALGVGEAALLSAHIGRIFGAAMPAPAPRRDPVPFLAIAAALVLAAIGALPALAEAPAWMSDAPAALTRAVPIFVHGVVTLLRGAGSLAPSVTFAAAAVLVAIGAAIARLAPVSFASRLSPPGAQS